MVQKPEDWLKKQVEIHAVAVALEQPDHQPHSQSSAPVLETSMLQVGAGGQYGLCSLIMTMRVWNEGVKGLCCVNAELIVVNCRCLCLLLSLLF